MYQIGDIVAYGTDGVCRIEDITSKKFGDEVADYYVLKPIHKNVSTVFVPLGNPSLLARMRQVQTQEQILAMIRRVRSAEPEWISQERERKQQFKEILASGDLGRILELLKLLWTYQDTLKTHGKKLHIFDDHCLKEAQRLVDDECSYVLNIRPDEVAYYIRSRLKEG